MSNARTMLLPRTAMTASDLPIVLSHRYAVVQEARGQPGIGLTLHLLLQAGADESLCLLQLEPSQVWRVRDVCVALASRDPGRYQEFLAKRSASHQLNYGDKFLKTLRSDDAYGRFHRRYAELAIPVAFRTGLQPENTAVLSGALQSSDGLVLRFSLAASSNFGCVFPHDLAFLLADSMDEAIWAAEWERGGVADATSR